MVFMHKQVDPQRAISVRIRDKIPFQVGCCAFSSLLLPVRGNVFPGSLSQTVKALFIGGVVLKPGCTCTVVINWFRPVCLNSLACSVVAPVSHPLCRVADMQPVYSPGGVTCSALWTLKFLASSLHLPHELQWNSEPSGLITPCQLSAMLTSSALDPSLLTDIPPHHLHSLHHQQIPSPIALCQPTLFLPVHRPFITIFGSLCSCYLLLYFVNKTP